MILFCLFHKIEGKKSYITSFAYIVEGKKNLFEKSVEIFFLLTKKSVKQDTILFDKQERKSDFSIRVCNVTS
jgi:hypothetical protein